MKLNEEPATTLAGALVKERLAFGIGILGIGIVTGCVSSLRAVPVAPEVSAVRLTNNSQATAGCQFLGAVQSNPNGFVATQWSSHPPLVEDSVNQMKTAALKLGGNLVYSQGPLPTNEPQLIGKRVLTGEAYRCPTPKATPD